MLPRTATASKTPKAWAFPRFWVSIRSYKKQPVTKNWVRILGLVWLKFAVASLIYHCHFANQAYIWCFRMGARNPRISELKVCGTHEFSRESIIDVGAQIPNALYD